jgi:TRAP-type mannitol/chloroaromatic compound transport system permease large subunit
MELIKEFLKSVILHPDFHRYFSYCFFALVVYVMRGYFWVNRGQLMKDMKGEDGRWDAVEVAFFVWIILFSVAILGSLFFGLTMPHEAWWSLDTMGVFVLAGKRGPDIVMAMKSNKSNQKETINPPTQDKKKGGLESEDMSNL